MDVMELRRGLMAQMAGGNHVRMATGEFTQVSGVVYLNHNLGSKKILVVMQRVNSDHSNIDTTNQYQSIAFIGLTVEAIQWDTTQTYSLNGGTQAHYDSTDLTTNGAYLKGANAYFPGNTASYPGSGTMAYANRAVKAYDGTSESDNTVQIYPGYGLVAGRWVWTAYALD